MTKRKDVEFNHKGLHRIKIEYPEDPKEPPKVRKWNKHGVEVLKKVPDKKP